jgi:hypothetical protein
MNTNDYDLYLLEADNSTVVEITDPLALNEPSLSVAIPILGTETSFSPTSVEFVQLQHRGMSGTAVRRVQKVDLVPLLSRLCKGKADCGGPLTGTRGLA